MFFMVSCKMSLIYGVINPSNKHPERIKTTDKKIAEKLYYDEIEFPVKEKKVNRI